MTLTGWLKHKGLSQHAFARRSFVNVATISRFLAGLSGLSPTNIQRIERATAGEVTFDELVAEGRSLRKRRRRVDAVEVRP